MAPLKDITNSKILLFPNEENIQQNMLPPSPQLLTNRMDLNRSFSTESNESLSPRSRNIRFPARLSLQSYTGSFSDLSPDDLSHSSDEECFFDSSLDSSYSFSSLNISSSCSGTPTRRKRLSLSTPFDETSSFKKMNLVDKNQLVDLVCDVSKLSIDHSKVTISDFPTVDSLLNREKKLLKNIRRALPERVYGSTRDAVSFKRVEVHLLIFKQEVLKQMRYYFENSLWVDLLEYITKSWQIVKHLPQWDNTSHNLHKEQIFNIMASYTRKTIKLRDLDKFHVKQIKSRIYANKDVHSSVKKLLDVF